MTTNDREYVKSPGWYAVLATQNPHNRRLIAKGPFRTTDEIEWAIHHYIYKRCPGIDGMAWLREMQCVVLGPYASRSAAREATLDDSVGRVPLFTGGWWNE